MGLVIEPQGSTWRDSETGAISDRPPGRGPDQLARGHPHRERGGQLP